MRNDLTPQDIAEIKAKAREKLGMCRMLGDVIGTKVFFILGHYARVIYYPLGENAPWGLTRISGSKNDSQLKKPFVAINSSIPKPCQVFAAAHELYHIWYERRPSVLTSDSVGLDSQDRNELRANRFASEFLVSDTVLRQQLELYQIHQLNTKSVLLLADLFMIPYREMVERLFELDWIDAKTCELMLKPSALDIEQCRKKYAYPIHKADNTIAVDNLAELTISAFDERLITYEKMEYLLEICGLKPLEDFGICKKPVPDFPSEKELDEIMESENDR